jgi:exopolyphosphatase / guanosine-5'-triphosphate,3'-diphosphate pyrophosphatase
MTNPIFAVVDIGSNSLKVTVVDTPSMKELGRSTESIRLFPSGDNPVRLHSDKIELGAQAVSRLVKFAQDKGAQKIVLLGTSAVRDCVNREDFSAKIMALSGMPLTIISGEVEARLAALGVRVDPVYADYKNILAFDLGGGSLEISKLHGKQCTFARSYPLGSVRLTSQLQSRQDGVIDEAHQLNFQAIIQSQLKDAMLNEAARDSLIVGAGGAFTAIALYLESAGEAAVAGRLPALRIRELKDRICKLTTEERKKLKGIPADRIDIMPAALLTICVLADLTQAEAFYLTHHGVRQGMIQLLIEENAHP